MSSIESERPTKVQKVRPEEMNAESLERDPGLRPKIWDFHPNIRNELRRVYIKEGPFQPRLPKYLPSGPEDHQRKFQAHWFDDYPTWLEYSPTTNAIYCLPCYLFAQPTGRHGDDAFTIKGFNNWKKVRDGIRCPLLNHVGKDPNGSHNRVVKACEDLIDRERHIDKLIKKQTSQEIANQRLRLRTSIECVRWLTFQGCAMRGNDESKDSLNRGNFIELVHFLSNHNEEIARVVLDNAPGNAKSTSSKIQKEILHIFATQVRKVICEEIGTSKFCIIVDEARDESKKEQMAVILRFVDKEGFIKERFFDIAHVQDTSVLTLKNEICAILRRCNLHTENLRGQGYDGANNMRGEWNGLQALFRKDCKFAYYVHCFAHRLQLALVAASREVKGIHQFFTHLTSIVIIFTSSTKRNDELKKAQVVEVQKLVPSNKLATGMGENQIGTLQRAGDTRWSSHYDSICSLIRMYNATCSVLDKISDDDINYSQRGDAEAAYEVLKSFEFVLILHLMEELMGSSNILCQALQQRAQDILNAMSLVSSTKVLIQNLRDNEWEKLLSRVKVLCEEHEIVIPDMNAPYIRVGGRGRRQSPTSMEHYFKFDIFIAAIDVQLQELNSRFSEQTVELLILSSALSPADSFKSFKIDDICSLVDKFYPEDFADQEKIELKFQLQHFELDVIKNLSFQELSSISELCRTLVSTGKSKVFTLIDRLIRLVLTLPVSTASGKRAFSAMKLVKTRLRNKMGDNYLADSLLVYIEKEIAQSLSIDMILDEFLSIKSRH